MIFQKPAGTSGDLSMAVTVCTRSVGKTSGRSAGAAPAGKSSMSRIAGIIRMASRFLSVVFCDP
jgi:hypothetical protein